MDNAERRFSRCKIESSQLGGKSRDSVIFASIFFSNLIFATLIRCETFLKNGMTHFVIVFLET